jgi:hypothetical protein
MQLHYDWKYRAEMWEKAVISNPNVTAKLPAEFGRRKAFRSYVNIAADNAIWLNISLKMYINLKHSDQRFLGRDLVNCLWITELFLNFSPINLAQPDKIKKIHFIRVQPKGSLKRHALQIILQLYAFICFWIH